MKFCHVLAFIKCKVGFVHRFFKVCHFCCFHILFLVSNDLEYEHFIIFSLLFIYTRFLASLNISLLRLTSIKTSLQQNSINCKITSVYQDRDFRIYLIKKYFKICITLCSFCTQTKKNDNFFFRNIHLEIDIFC